jgi:hypothetical protein
MSRTPLVHVALVGVSFVVLLATPAEAYIDPGVGSYIFQMLMAVFFSAAFTVKLHWKAVKLLFSRLLSRSGADGPTE